MAGKGNFDRRASSFLVGEELLEQEVFRLLQKKLAIAQFSSVITGTIYNRRGGSWREERKPPRRIKNEE